MISRICRCRCPQSAHGVRPEVVRGATVLVSGSCANCSCPGFRAASELVSRRLVFALALAVAAVAVAEPRALNASSAVVTLQDGGVVAVDGGVWLSDRALDDAFAERLRLRAENESLKAHAGDVEAKRLLEVGGGGVLVGGTAGVTVRALALPYLPAR